MELQPRCQYILYNNYNNLTSTSKFKLLFAQLQKPQVGYFDHLLALINLPNYTHLFSPLINIKIHILLDGKFIAL